MKTKYKSSSGQPLAALIFLFYVIFVFIIQSCQGQYYRTRQGQSRRLQTASDYWQLLGFLDRLPNPSSSRTAAVSQTPPSTTTTTTTTTTPKPKTPLDRLTSIMEAQTGIACGVRTSGYMPHLKLPPSKVRQPRKGPLRRQGRVVWTDDDSQGSQPPPSGSYPWMASLFMLVPNSEEGVALFMCAGTILTPNVIATAAHCFTGNADNADLWFVRVGDNFILRPEEDEQTFRVRKIVKHHQFKPLSDPDGDGRNDIAIVVLQNHVGEVDDYYGKWNSTSGLINFGPNVRPVCPPVQQDYPVVRLRRRHCEIAGWGMTEYNNTSSYPDSVRAAKITVGDVSKNYCDYLYKRDVAATGKFCAGGKIDACQEDSGGPLVCKMDDGRYHFIGVVSSGKGCGIYPGLYTDVSRYVDWLAFWIERESRS